MTLKSVTFISDSRLRQILIDILCEIDSISVIGAARSTVYLSMSTLEGILSYLIKINEAKARAFPDFPEVNGNQKQIDRLNFDDKILIANKLNFIEDDYYQTFQRMRKLRNYMHPYAELDSPDAKIDLGTSQISLGILNHMLSNLGQRRFIQSSIWNVLYGEPIYEQDDKVILKKLGHAISFLYTDDFRGRPICVEFDLNISAKCLLNFVFNFHQPDSPFYMLRFDARDPNNNGFLLCKHYPEWDYLNHFNYRLNTDTPNHIRIECLTDTIKVNINGQEPVLDRGSPKFDNRKSIGFFNEISSLTIEHLRIS